MSKATQKQREPDLYAERQAARRRLADAFRKLAKGKKYTAAERAEFARMADAWAATLPQKK